ncbi:MAG: flagellar hook-associated protein FlgK [Thermodesulfobacteriota bacterium]|nr:flagellar hook-associated protein FlgK [Thermodesulfobacteriota bacterium]
MPGLTGALGIAQWSLYASQLSIEVTANNIANANTPGYSRQDLRVSANYPITMGPGQIGTGVKAEEVQRANNEFVNKQLNEKTSEYFYWEAEKGAMEEIEMIFNESNESGINEMMGEFWNAWGDLSNNPDGLPQREALIAKSKNFTSAIKAIDYNLRAYQRHLDSNIQGSVQEVNSIISQIAGLNKEITAVEIDGVINANDLRDRRELLLGELSGYMDINYYEEGQSGKLMVFVMGGTPLVLGKEAYSLSSERNPATGYTDVLWNDQTGRTVDITHKIEGGKLAGWVDVRDTKIDSYLDSMNTLSEEIVWQVNELHAQGAGLNSVSSMTGTVDITDPTLDIGGTGYLFGDRFSAGGTFDIVVYDDATGVMDNTFSVTLNAGATVNDLVGSINGTGNMNAEIDAGNHLHIHAGAGYTFAVKPHDADTQNNDALAVLGVNTFFSWNRNDGELTETLAVNAVVENDPDRISAGHLDADNHVAPGDNSAALAAFGLQDKVVSMDGNNTTMDSYYSSFVAKVGVDTNNAQMNEKFNETLKDQYLQRKESITGVNMDEEMSALLKYQHSYQASAKLISIVDELLQTLIRQ